RSQVELKNCKKIRVHKSKVAKTLEKVEQTGTINDRKNEYQDGNTKLTDRIKRYNKPGGNDQ
ncbi:hypothetical protein DICPUDRAFT_159321, partial [Dictyostelium purpureum]